MAALLSLLAFLVVATGIIGSMVVGAMVLRVKSRAPTVLQRTTYECGELPSGMAWVRFHARYYVVALFFVLFDLEAAFLFPWATAARDLGPSGLYGALSFMLVLMVGWVWAMRKGALKWQ